MSLDPQTITITAAGLASVITAFGIAAERIIRALRHPPDPPPKRRRVRKSGEDGDG